MTTDANVLPLLERFPALTAIPRVSLCDLPSPVLRASVGGTELWIKHDGVNAPVAGGNKVRMLEFLLAGVAPGDTVLTVGGEGSTHVLSTAVHAARLGARTVALRWRHEMNPTAIRIAQRVVAGTISARVHRFSGIAVTHAQWRRLASRMRAGGVRYIPLGGSTPRGVLGMVNGGLELALQIRAGELPLPSRIVVALGSGGTMAGLALGLAIAELDVSVIGVQVTPAIIANRSRVQRLVARTARLIEHVTRERVRRPATRLLGVARGAYGGAYGRLVPSAAQAAERLDAATGIRLDQTYTAKALAVALELARDRRMRAGPTLFWNTFDSRLLEDA